MSHASPIIIEVALLVVVNTFIEQLIASRTLRIGTLSWINRLSFLTLEYQSFGPFFHCRLLLQAETIPFERLMMVLYHVLSKRYSSLRTAFYVTDIAPTFSLFNHSFRVAFAWYHYIRL